MTDFHPCKKGVFRNDEGLFTRIDRVGLYASEEAATLATQLSRRAEADAWRAHRERTDDNVQPWTVDDVRVLLTAEERERAVSRLPARFEFPELVGGGAKWVLRAPGGREAIAESPREYDSVEEAHAAAFMVVEAFADIASSGLYDMIPNEDKE